MAEQPSVVVEAADAGKGEGTGGVTQQEQHSSQQQSPSMIKGILRKRDRKDEDKTKRRSGVQWNEMNILMTEHPPDKDYGHMKINEPKTPYHEMAGDEEEDRPELMDRSKNKEHAEFAEELADRVQQAAVSDSKPSKWEREFDSDDELSEEQKEHKRKFKEWRTAHYNEFQAVRRARQLMMEEDEDDDDDEVQTQGKVVEDEEPMVVS